MAEGPKIEEYIGEYKIYSPELFLSDSLVSRKLYTSNDSVSMNLYMKNKNLIKNSYLEIYDNGTFKISNNLLKDSIGTWEDAYFDYEYGSMIPLHFNNTRGIANFRYEDKDYRILQIPDILFKDSVKYMLEDLGSKFIYKKIKE